MRAGDLSKLEISKTLYTHYTRVASFDFGDIQTWKTIFFDVRSPLCIHHPVIDNCLFQCAVKQPIKLTSWTIFFRANIIQREFNLLQTEQVNSWLPPSLLLVLWAFDCTSVLTHAVDLWQVQLVHKFTNTFWPWRNSLKLHVLMFSVQEEGFPVWTSLLLFTVC